MLSFGTVGTRWLRLSFVLLTLLHACAEPSEQDEALGVHEQALSEAFVAYHNITASDHQVRMNSLSAAGYRPVSLSVSGDPLDPRYAAVWVQRGGAQWVEYHGISAADYQARFDQLVAQGFAPSIVSATGPASRAIFAAVFERGVSGAWYARHNQTWDGISQAMADAFAQDFLPASIAVYGDANDRRYAGVWRKNVDHVAWSWWQTGDAAAYQRYFDALNAGGNRPALLSVASDGATMLSVFRDDKVGPWVARHNLTAAQYQTAFDDNLAQGRRPLLVTAGAGRYAAIFAQRDATIARTWNVAGANAPVADEIDATVEQFMKARGIRAGSVAIGRLYSLYYGQHGGIKFDRAYTWAEPSYPLTQPSTRFRIASLSKIFTAAETSRLVNAGRLAWSTPAFGFVGITSALPLGTPSDPALATISVQQLVLRSSHLMRDFANERDIAKQLGYASLPVPRSALLGWLYGRPLDPNADYSNTAFHLLTSVVETGAGLGYMQAVQRDVLDGLGIHDVEVGASAVNARKANEVSGYDAAGISASQFNPNDTALAPDAYGGAFVLENGEGAGGLIAPAHSIAKVIARYPVWNADAAHLSGREINTREGRLAGTASGAHSRADGLDLAFLFNRTISDADFESLVSQLDSILDRRGGEL